MHLYRFRVVNEIRTLMNYIENRILKVQIIHGLPDSLEQSNFGFIRYESYDLL